MLAGHNKYIGNQIFTLRKDGARGERAFVRGLGLSGGGWFDFHGEILARRCLFPSGTAACGGAGLYASSLCRFPTFIPRCFGGRMGGNSVAELRIAKKPLFGRPEGQHSMRSEAQSQCCAPKLPPEPPPGSRRAPSPGREGSSGHGRAGQPEQPPLLCLQRKAPAIAAPP